MNRTDYELEDFGRLTHPLVYDRATDTFRAVEWEAAFARIGEILRGLAPEQVEFYTSDRASNEAAYLYQLFAREYGTNNFPDCSNVCHEPTSVGLPRSIGIGKGTVSLDEFDECELIISIGHNPGTNHPRMMGTYHEASRRKVPILVQPAARTGAGALCGSAEHGGDGHLWFHPDCVVLLPGPRRGRRRGHQGGDEGTAGSGSQPGQCAGLRLHLGPHRGL
ncbi:hypothetical protein CS8_010510 [Cupriavidus sp. 8B]